MKAEIFEAIIKKGLANGWIINNLAHQYEHDLNRWRVIQSNIDDIYLDIVFRRYIKPVMQMDNEYDDYHIKFSVEQIIFNIDFAKAFFGIHIIADCGLPLIDEEKVEKNKRKLLDEKDDNKKDEYFYKWAQFEKTYCVLQYDPEGVHTTCEAWEYYLPVLVLQEDRLKYLGQFI